MSLAPKWLGAELPGTSVTWPGRVWLGSLLEKLLEADHIKSLLMKQCPGCRLWGLCAQQRASMRVQLKSMRETWRLVEASGLQRNAFIMFQSKPALCPAGPFTK